MSTVKQRLGGFISQLPLFLGLVLLWALLWGRFSWLNLVTGAVFAAIVSVVFYLPAVQLSGRINLWRTAWLFGKLFFDIVRASVDVSWLALGPTYRPSNAVVAVHLRTRSDLLLTWTAVATSIVPGSIVVDIDRVNSTLYLHVINMRTAGEADTFRARVLATERRIVMALGSVDDVERVCRVRVAEGHTSDMPGSPGPHSRADLAHPADEPHPQTSDPQTSDPQTSDPQNGAPS